MACMIKYVNGIFFSTAIRYLKMAHNRNRKLTNYVGTTIVQEGMCLPPCDTYNN